MATPPAWLPRPEQIKALIPQRVAGRPFSDTSIPSEAEVMQLIEFAAADVSTALRGTLTPGCEGMATYLVALAAAAEVERALYPEQAIQPGSQYELLRQRFIDRWNELYICVHGVPDPSTVPGAPAVFPPPPPRGVFPEPVHIYLEPSIEVFEPISDLSE